MSKSFSHDSHTVWSSQSATPLGLYSEEKNSEPAAKLPELSVDPVPVAVPSLRAWRDKAKFLAAAISICLACAGIIWGVAQSSSRAEHRWERLDQHGVILDTLPELKVEVSRLSSDMQSLRASMLDLTRAIIRLEVVIATSKEPVHD
jgi:hypothetical protein